MKNEPLVSVIIPIYNSEKFLGECLDSVLAQTFKDIEIICVNDGSTDKSNEILREYEKRDPRVKIVKQKNKGTSTARKNGVAASRSKYVCFVDSDDTVDRTYVEKMYNAIIEHNVKVALCGLRMSTDKPKARIHDNSKIVENDAKFFFEHYRMAETRILAQTTPCKLFSRNLFDAVDYSVVKTNILEDNFIIPQLLVAAGEKLAVIDETLYNYRVGHDSTMSKALTGRIDVCGEKMAYTDLFDMAMKFVARTYGVNFDVNYINRLRAQEFYCIASGVNDLNEYARDLERANKEKDEIITAILSSKSYRIGQFISAPCRFLRGKR
ncbi:glycosyltransferase [Candidatus Saccharibacteria bacterium]|nr:glycosyltransferase [Candidatus Saccharibacteria bacterium]MCL1962902.1 glycosyltransferase [Candidatus Saccharibacteria bacterium]